MAWSTESPKSASAYVMRHELTAALLRTTCIVGLTADDMLGEAVQRAATIQQCLHSNSRYAAQAAPTMARLCRADKEGRPRTGSCRWCETSWRQSSPVWLASLRKTVVSFECGLVCMEVLHCVEYSELTVLSSRVILERRRSESLQLTGGIIWITQGSSIAGNGGLEKTKTIAETAGFNGCDGSSSPCMQEVPSHRLLPERISAKLGRGDSGRRAERCIY